MIVMIYGTPRSGKSTLIDQLMVYYAGKAVHLKLSKIMNEIAMNSYNEHFSEDMPTDKKDFLYQEAKKIINYHNETSKYVFMDCHAGYLSKNGEFYDFRPDDYHRIGHFYFYLKTDASIVYERMLKTNGQKAYYDYSVDEIRLYQDKEIQRLKSIVNKEIKILDIEPFINIIKELSYVESTEINKKAWDFDSYDFWVKKYGTPEVMAENIKTNQDDIFYKYQPYLGDVINKDIVCVCDSCGRLANSLAFHGANVTVFDNSIMGEKYATECSLFLNNRLNYLVRDFSKDSVVFNKFDIAVSSVGVLHYFVDIKKFMNNVFALLKEGGIYVIHDFHPFLKTIDNGSLAVQINDDYFFSQPFTGEMPYNTSFSKLYPKCVYREYTISEILTSAIEAKFRITGFDELRFCGENYPTSFVLTLKKENNND